MTNVLNKGIKFNSSFSGVKGKFLPEVDSTNEYLKQLIRVENIPEFFYAQTDFQTAGKGQPGSTWEAEKGKNLLFSLVIYPQKIEITHQFIISQIISLAIQQTLSEYTNDILIKWPNDIYWRDKKIVGILIENSLQNQFIKNSVIGIGININQEKFTDVLPNPVSLKNITGKEYDRNKVLEKVINHFILLYSNLDETLIQKKYLKNLFRKNGFYKFQKPNGEAFKAKIMQVDFDGKIHLQKENGEIETFYFKEVQFLL